MIKKQNKKKAEKLHIINIHHPLDELIREISEYVVQISGKKKKNGQETKTKSNLPK